MSKTGCRTAFSLDTPCMFFYFFEHFIQNVSKICKIYTYSVLSVKDHSCFVWFQNTRCMISVVGDQFFTFFSLKQITGHFFVCKIAGYYQFLVTEYSLICINLIAVFQQTVEDTINDHFILMAQADQFLIIIEDAVFVCQCFFCIDLHIIFVDTDPRSPCHG